MEAFNSFSFLNFDSLPSHSFNSPEPVKRNFSRFRKNVSGSPSIIDSFITPSKEFSALRIDCDDQLNLQLHNNIDLENVQPRQTSQPSTPKLKPKKLNSGTPTDRYIPNRKVSRLSVALTPSHSSFSSKNNSAKKSLPEDEEDPSSSFSHLYKNLVLGYETQKVQPNTDSPFANRNIFRYKDQNKAIDSPFKLSKRPLEGCEDILSVTQTPTKKISKAPFKVLDAPALIDDFYLNLLDWSSQNILGVGLASCVYLWSGNSGRVTKLCDLGINDVVTSVTFSPQGEHVCLGANSGLIHIWDCVKNKRISTFSGHQARVGVAAWGSSLLATGSRDKNILCRDLRVNSDYVTKMEGHAQEVCGLKWSFDNQQLASGGNDNKVHIWSSQSTIPLARYNEHQAGVKALAWSPHQHGLLATGGGTADRTIRFWNTLTNTQIDHIDTGSQVCNLMFSKNSKELVSTHGYSQNQVNIWKYPTMEKTATLTGHTFRVLYLAMSPDGQNIVTGAGDETLRFWNAFPLDKENGNSAFKSKLDPSRFDIR